MMTATRSMGGVVGSATPAASAWVKSADPWPTRISVLHPAFAPAGIERFLCAACACAGLAAPRYEASSLLSQGFLVRFLLLSAMGQGSAQAGTAARVHPSRLGSKPARALLAAYHLRGSKPPALPAGITSWARAGPGRALAVIRTGPALPGSARHAPCCYQLAGPRDPDRELALGLVGRPRHRSRHRCSGRPRGPRSLGRRRRRR